MSYPGKTKEITGLVLSVTDFQERDQILHVLTDTGLVSVYAKGVQNPKSRNRRLAQPFSRVHLWCTDHAGNQMENLIHGDLQESYAALNADLKTSAAAGLVRDVLLKSPDPEQMNWLLPDLFSTLKEREVPVVEICFLLKESLELSGIAPYVNGCVVCGSTSGIETLSTEQGGFLCAHCNTRHTHIMEKERLRRYRLLFSAKKENFPVVRDQGNFTEDDILFLAGFLEYHSGQELKSLNFYRTVLKMF